MRSFTSITEQSMQLALTEADKQQLVAKTIPHSFPAPATLAIKSNIALNQGGELVVLQARNSRKFKDASGNLVVKDQEDRWFATELSLELAIFAPAQIGQLLADTAMGISEQLKHHADGAVLIVTLAYQEAVYTLGIGDCRAVLAQIDTQDKVSCQRLNVEHLASMASEQKRIKKAGGFITEEDVPRLNGVLMPSRTIGDRAHRGCGLDSNPVVTRCQLNSNTTAAYLFVSSDGFTDGVDEDLLQNYLKRIIKNNQRTLAAMHKHPAAISKKTTITPILSVNTAQQLYELARQEGSDDDITLLMTAVPPQGTHGFLTGVVDGHGGDTVSKLVSQTFPRHLQRHIEQINALIAPLQQYIQQQVLDTNRDTPLQQLRQQLIDLALSEIRQGHLTYNSTENALKKNLVYQLTTFIVAQLNTDVDLNEITNSIKSITKLLKPLRGELYTIWQTEAGECLRTELLQLQEMTVKTLLQAFPNTPQLPASFTITLSNLQERRQQLQPLLEPLITLINRMMPADDPMLVYQQAYFCRRQKALLDLLNQTLASELNQGHTPEDVENGFTFSGKILQYINNTPHHEIPWNHLLLIARKLLASLKSLEAKLHSPNNTTLKNHLKQIVAVLDFKKLLFSDINAQWRHLDAIQIIIQQMVAATDHSLENFDLIKVLMQLDKIKISAYIISTNPDHQLLQSILGYLLQETVITWLMQGVDLDKDHSLADWLSCIHQNLKMWQDFFTALSPTVRIKSNTINDGLTVLHYQLAREVLGSHKGSWTSEDVRVAIDTVQAGVTFKTINAMLAAITNTDCLMQCVTKLNHPWQASAEFNDWLNELFQDIFQALYQGHSITAVQQGPLGRRLNRFSDVQKTVDDKAITSDELVRLLNWPLIEKRYLIELLKLCIQRSQDTSQSNSIINPLQNLQISLESEIAHKDNRSLQAFYQEYEKLSQGLDKEFLAHILQNSHLLPQYGLYDPSPYPTQTQLARVAIFLKKFTVSQESSQSNISAEELTQKLHAFLEAKINILFSWIAKDTQKILDAAANKNAGQFTTAVAAVTDLLTTDPTLRGHANLNFLKPVAIDIAEIFDGNFVKTKWWLFGDKEYSTDTALQQTLATAALEHSTNFYQKLVNHSTSQSPVAISQTEAAPTLEQLYMAFARARFN